MPADIRLQMRSVHVTAMGLITRYRFVRRNGWPNGKWCSTEYLAWIDLRRHLKRAA